MRILVLGSSGQLGSCFREEHEKWPQHEWFNANSKCFDLRNIQRMTEVFDDVKPDVIINCSGYTNVDNAEVEKELCMELNVIVPWQIAKYCKEHNTKLIHFSTDYVFDGTKDGEYVETDDPMFGTSCNFYGASKAQGELNVLHANPNGFIIRISGLVSLYGQNFIKTMFRKFTDETCDQVNVVFDQITKLTSGHNLAAQVMHLIESQLDRKGISIAHYADGPSGSWFQHACMVKDIMTDKGITNTAMICGCTTEAADSKTPRPKNSVLNCFVSSVRFGIKPGYIYETVERIIDNEIRNQTISQ